MVRLGILYVLAGCGLLLSPSWNAFAGEKDASKAGTERKATNEDEPAVVEISEEGFACNEEVISVGGFKAKGWYKLNDKNRFEVKKGEDLPLLAIRGKTIRWWCAAAFEDFQADTGAEFIVISRGPRGAGKVIYYKSK